MHVSFYFVNLVGLVKDLSFGGICMEILGQLPSLGASSILANKFSINIFLGADSL